MWCCCHSPIPQSDPISDKSVDYVRVNALIDRMASQLVDRYECSDLYQPTWSIAGPFERPMLKSVARAGLAIGITSILPHMIPLLLEVTMCDTHITDTTRSVL